MPIQILPNRRTPYGDASEALGQGIGSGIQSGLDQLLRRRAQEQQMQQNRVGLQAFFSPEEAQRISMLPEPLQLQALKNAQMQQKQQLAQHQQSLLQQQRQQEQFKKEILETQKMHKGALDQIANEGVEAEAERGIINDIEEIIKSGKYEGPDWIRRGLDKVGLGANYMNKETQLAQKLMQKLALQQQQSGKGKMTDEQLKAYERANLSLMNTADGAKLILESLKLDVDKKTAVDKARKKVLRLYSGQPLPFDIIDQIREEAEKSFDKIGSREQSIDKKYNHYINKYISQEPDEDSTLMSIAKGALRTSLRTGARAGEALLGLPGDIVSGAGSLGGLAAQGLGFGEQYQQLREKTPQILPTSENIRENITKPLSGEYLEPQGKTEQYYDEFVGDLATLWVPGKIASKGIKGVSKLASYFAGPGGLGKQAARAAAAGAANFMGKEVVGSEALGGALKAGTLIATGLPGAKGVLKDKSSELYNKAESILAQEKPIVQSKSLGDELNKLSHWAHEGRGTNSEAKKEVFDIIKSIDQQINNRGISVKNALEARRDIGNKMASGKLEPQAIKKVSGLYDKLNDIVQEYGLKNKEFGNSINEADSIYRVLKAENKIGKFVKDNLDIDSYANKKFIKSFLLMTNPIAGLKTVAAYKALGKVNEGANFLKMIVTNKPAQKYLLKAWASALANDKAALSSAVKSLDQSLSRANKPK